MRIITGEYKGRRLYAPDNDDIRPTSDKVKEALFSMIAFDLQEAVCVDLFAGTGLLKDDGLIIAEHWHTMEMADKICGFVKVKERKYGHIILSIYRHG